MSVVPHLNCGQAATADQVTSIDEARLKRELKARLADITVLLGRHVSSARRLLRVLMEQPLRCEAVREGDRKEYRVTGTGRYLPLLPETLAPFNSMQENCSVVVGVPNGARQTREQPKSNHLASTSSCWWWPHEHPPYPLKPPQSHHPEGPDRRATYPLHQR